MSSTWRLPKVGAALGVVAGLVATLVETPFVLDPEIHLRVRYPFALGAFNLVFWVGFGLTSAFVLWSVERLGWLRRPAGGERDWICAFLAPFAVVYTLGGRVYPLLSSRAPLAGYLFDHVLPTFVALALVALVWARRPAGPSRSSVPPLAFFFETSSIVVLVHAAAHLRGIVWLLGLPVHARTLAAIDLLLVAMLAAFLSFGAPRLTTGITSLLGEPRASRSTVAALALLALAMTATAGVLGHGRTESLEAGLSQLSRPRAPVAAPGVPVILIVLDTVRADRTSVYGSVGRTPNLEVLARDAVVFDDARSASSWTLPSHASIFTGLSPREHGSHHVLGDDPELKHESTALSGEFKTIAELFRDRGYLTAGVISNFAFVGRAHNFQQGFDLFDDRKGTGYGFRMGLYGSVFQSACYVTGYCSAFIQPSRQADYISEVGLDVVRQAGDAPFFLFMNYYDAHMWYRPPAPYDGYFLAHTKHPKLYRMWLSFRRLVTKTLPDDEHLAFLHSQYEGTISYLDSELGLFFEALKELGVYDRALIVVTSDHGELFDEHGFRFHGTPLYEGAVKVPLLIKYPGATRTGRDDTLITSVDLLPTILSVAGLPVPDGLSGRVLGGEPFSISELYDNDPRHHVGEHRALVRWPYKLMHFGSDRPAELYDLQSDPSERTNLAAARPELTAALEAELHEWEAEHPPRHQKHGVNSGEEEAKMLEQLHALGYAE